MRWGTTPAVLLLAIGCGGRLLPLSEQDGGRTGVPDADGGNDGGAPEGQSVCEPPPVPVCTGDNFMCLPPDAGIVWTGAAVIKCQGVECIGPWTLVLERLIGSTWELVQKQVLQEPGFGYTFYDTSGPPARLTYRVCAVDKSGIAQCGAPFTTQGPSSCACEPTSCWLQTACLTKIDDQCGGTIDCGACPNGISCNMANHTCCPMGFMSDGWGKCVCAPPSPKACSIWDWNTTTCTCDPGGRPTPL